MSPAHRRRETALLRKAVARLRERCPASRGLPVRVRRINPPAGEFGMTFLARDRKSFVIWLAKDVYDDVLKRRRPLSYGELRDTLTHEWAHTLSWWPLSKSRDHHDAAWGRAFSKVYRAELS